LSIGTNSLPPAATAQLSGSTGSGDSQRGAGVHARPTHELTRPKLSVVTMVYRSRQFLDEFIAQASAAARANYGDDYELVFVIDGSPDDSLEFLRARQAHDPRITIVDLSRNFGHHQAAWCGLHVARGERVFIIDCDLEVSPDILGSFHDRMQATRIDVVYGYQEKRSGNSASRTVGDLFWRIFNLMSPTIVPRNICTERLMSRRYVDALLTMGDRNLFLAGMYFWAGFEQIGVPIQRRPREGRTSYTFFRRVQLMVRAISAFSSVPLQASFWLGLVIAIGSVAYGGWLVTHKLLNPDAVLSGFTSLSLLMTMSTGMIMMGLGVIGLYVSRIYNQTQNRPVFVIRSIYRDGEEQPPL
jgi:putative glycosyltransferase